MSIYKAVINDGSSGIEEFEADSLIEAWELAVDWVSEGDWAIEGCIVDLLVWNLEDETEKEFGSVEIPPDHRALIREATFGHTVCGDKPEDHEWTSEGEGGIDDNPGVYGLSGTGMAFYAHCLVCGLHREVINPGSQPNPGEIETTIYRMLDNDEIEKHRAQGTMDKEQD